MLVFVVGSASLGAEIAAARLMAPYFGASTIVWANTIGVVLVALSLGYWLGGRIADRHPEIGGLCRLVLAASLLLAVVPFAARPFFEVSVDALDQISAGAFVGSLLGVLVLIAVPVVLLGACAPYAVRLAVPDVEHAGTVAGRLYAISTAGSLVGTMLSALVLIPFIGTQRTFLTFAVMLAAVGGGRTRLALRGRPRRGRPGDRDPGRHGQGDRRGRERPLGGGDPDPVRQGGRGGRRRPPPRAQRGRRRALALQAGQLSDRQLLGRPAGPALRRTRRRSPRRVAILGNAAGTAQRAYGHYFPGIRVDGVEIDGELTELGERYFDLQLSDRLRVFDEDARPWLHDSTGATT